MKKQPRNIDENNQKMDPFEEMLHVMDFEHLLRFRRRLEKIGRKAMVAILTEEIDQRKLGERHKEK